VSGTLDRRLAALRDAAELAAGRLEDEDVTAARAVVDRAGARLGLGLESTVVALAGPTGVGKSQLFNVLAGAELAEVGRRRPTTSAGQAASWGEGSDALLDWLEIGRRHRVGVDGLDGLVLLDLPDFDSIETSHRLEAERVVRLADLVLWVVEPQKYADASLHDRYLRPLATHAEAMAVVLNQADLLAPADAEAWRRDMEGLLARDGVPKLPLVVVSARSGAGVPELRRLLTERVRARDAAVAKLAADLERAVEPLAAVCEGTSRGVRREDAQRLQEALEEAAGVPAVLRAVDEAHRRRGALTTGWPLVRWLKRFRPDPLRRLRLPESPQPHVRTSMPPPTDVLRAQVSSAARRLADGAAEGLPQPWPRLVREAAVAAEDRVADRLDRAVAGADLSVDRPAWWRLAGWLQGVLGVALAAGAVWLALLAALGWLRIEDVVPLPEVEGIPIPTLLLLGGAAAGLVLAFVARIANGVGARRRAKKAAASLRKRVDAVAQELVLDPVSAELDTHARLCAAVEAARRR
jgi:energy-coupling factor transporter ATP-binding protein EcfA2